MRILASIVLAGAVAVAGVGSADARRPAPPTVEVGSAGLLAPDGKSIATSVVASCADGSTVVQATVTVSQAQASGTGTFALVCIGPFPRVFPVTVVASSGTFSLAPAQATATVVVERGRAQSARSSATVQLDPAVVVTLADTATLVGAGGAVAIDVTVACAPGPSGLESYVAVTQGNLTGRGFYTPTCDGSPHTFSVTAVTAQGTFQAGDARALSFADVAWNGSFFTGVGDEPVQLME